MTAWFCRAEAARGLFWRLKAKGHIMVGITSYQEFPGIIRNPFDDRHTTEQDDVIINSIDAWLHCFRRADMQTIDCLLSVYSALLCKKMVLTSPSINYSGAFGPSVIASGA